MFGPEEEPVMNTAEPRPRRIRELGAGECMDLVASVPAGRIAHDDARGPIVIPVNHVVDRGTVVLRTSPASNLAGSVRGGWASYQVDDLGASGDPSWSVLLRGTIQALDPGEVQELPGRPEPQAEGVRTLYLRLTPRSITGRRLLPPL
jgi:nitroimidazol reductase NimA-like FMN-containing flavoprotein (pyridoxamine 5'-phosphate oxidase superfamily)